jgi:hypothetical protein
MACLSKIKKPEEALCSTVGTNGIKRERDPVMGHFRPYSISIRLI